MLPILEEAASHEHNAVSDLATTIEDRFGLSAAEREQVLPSGRQRTIVNRVHWAVSYMVHGRLLDRTGRGLVRVTDRGRQVLAEGPAQIGIKYLMRFSEFQDFRSKAGSKAPTPADADPQATPEEVLESTFDSIRQSVESDLLERVLAAPPIFFEQLVLDLLQAMGYGGSSAGEAARRVGRSGDDGIDGVIDEDKLGLDAVYIQAKRWAPDHPVRRPDVQGFAGSLEGQRATKGVFITTSRFTPDATEYVERISRRIRLIDGPTLTRLMYDHGIGVRGIRTFELRRVDTGYFEEQA